MKPLGLVLVVLGIVALIYGGISWTRKDTIVDAGPVEITRDKTEGRVDSATCRRAGAHRRGRAAGRARPLLAGAGDAVFAARRRDGATRSPSPGCLR